MSVVTFFIRHIGWFLPSLLVVSFVTVGWINVVGSGLGVARLGLYVIAFVGTMLGTIALFRQARAIPPPEQTPVLLIALFWQKVALCLLLVVLLLIGVYSFTPPPEDGPPEWIVFGALAASCMAFSATGIVLFFAGRRRQLAMPVHAGPLRYFFSRFGSSRRTGNEKEEERND